VAVESGEKKELQVKEITGVEFIALSNFYLLHVRVSAMEANQIQAAGRR